MLFHPGIQHPSNYLQLNQNGALYINYEPNLSLDLLEHRLIKLFAKLGYRSHSLLIKHLPMGNGLHYAGNIPMQKQPVGYQCDPQGRLVGTHNVYLIDGCCFSALPAKNLTLTIMANAMRIASLAGADL